jgi:hypothetical protein
VRTGGPRDLLGDGAYSAEIFGGVRSLSLKRGLRKSRGSCQEDEHGAHREIVSENRDGGLSQRLLSERYLAVKGAKEAVLPK